MRVPIRLPAKSKYRAKRTDGYASKKEAKRAAELGLLEKIGEVRDLKQQVRFHVLPVCGGYTRPLDYVADFTYSEKRKDGFWRRVVEDSKGFRTKEYKIKKRLMYQLLGIEIRET